jgi:hypothetical protein
VFPGDALAFIDGLASRWDEYQAELDKRGELAPVAVEPAVVGAPAEQAIFISYASQDKRLAEMITEALRGANLPVWFDKGGGLDGGMKYEAEIMTRIRGASVFVPLLTKNVLTPERRFFRTEWNEAIRVQARAAANDVFIVPVRFDDIAPTARELPPEFADIHWLDARNTADLPGVVQRIRDLYRRHLLAVSAPA